MLGTNMDTLLDTGGVAPRLKNTQALPARQPEQDVRRTERMIRAYLQTKDFDV